MTPEKVARRFAEGYVSYMFGPSGTMDDLVKSLVDFWVMQTRMWNARYANRAEAMENWLLETYNNMADTRFFSYKGVKDLVDVSTAAIGIHDFTFGSEYHKSKVWLLPLPKLKTGFALKIASSKVCHQDCPVAFAYWTNNLKSCIKALA
jgi:hypothetical protein